MNNASTRPWNIIPHVGVGPLQFGLLRSEVRSLLGEHVSVFRKGPYAKTETEAYDAIGIHLYYDAEERLECIEAWGPCQIHYEGVTLLNGNVVEVLEQLDELGLSSRWDDGYFLENGGFALYAPDGKVQAVTVYRNAAA